MKRVDIYNFWFYTQLCDNNNQYFQPINYNCVDKCQYLYFYYSRDYKICTTNMTCENIFNIDGIEFKELSNNEECI